MTTFTVRANEPVTLPLLTGGFTTGRKITFQTAEGCIGVVKVPDSLSIDEIRATIQTEADRLDTINGL